eukprot:gene11292-4103_t
MFAEVELSVSNRSLCAGCQQVLKKHEIRVRLRSAEGFGKCFHLKCFKSNFPLPVFNVQPELKENEKIQNIINNLTTDYLNEKEKYTKKRKLDKILQVPENLKKQKILSNCENILLNISDDVWCHILGFLDFREVIHNFSTISTMTFQLTYQDDLWNQFISRHYQNIISDETDKNSTVFSIFLDLYSKICIDCKKSVGKEFYCDLNDFVVCDECMKQEKYKLCSEYQISAWHQFQKEDFQHLKSFKIFNKYSRNSPHTKYLKSDVKQYIIDERKKLLLDVLKIWKFDGELSFKDESSIQFKFIHRKTIKSVKKVANEICNKCKNK